MLSALRALFETDRIRGRDLADVADWRPTELRRAAVLLPIVAHGVASADHVLFCVRHQGTHRHPNCPLHGCGE